MNCPYLENLALFSQEIFIAFIFPLYANFIPHYPLSMALPDLVREFPTNAGVYLMKNAQGEILYVGKAKNLRSRVLSYFGGGDGRYQIQYLMRKVATIETVVTQNEKEALLLENTLIKQHKPRYNLFLKDDKSYPSLKINIQHPFPRLITTRHVVKDGSIYFGPYTSAFRLYEIVKFIQTNFKIRSCNDHDFANRSRPCLQYQIKRCDAPCVDYISQETYAEMMQQVRLFLESRNHELEKLLENKMNEAAEQTNFEKAAYYRDLIESVGHLLEKQQVLKHEGTSMDVWGFARASEKIAIVLLIIRHGSMVDKKEWVRPDLGFQEEPEALSSFLPQYYQEAHLICSDILVPFLPLDHQELAEYLGELKEAKVRLCVPERGDKKAKLDLAQQNALEKLKLVNLEQENLQRSLESLQQSLELKNFPHKIECYDISNFQGDSAVGSCVAFEEGKAQKKNYRRFKIKHIQGPNDFAMHYEMMRRRLSHAEWPLPDLMIIDGGKGQLSSAYAALQDAGVSGVDIVGLAKEKTFISKPVGAIHELPQQELPPSELSTHESPPHKIKQKNNRPERVYLLNRKDPIVPHPQSAECHLLVKIRDETHRFGIEYHRKLRGKKTIQSLLDGIPGLGKERKKLLLREYGSLKNLAFMDQESVYQKTKIPREILDKVFAILRRGNS